MFSYATASGGHPHRGDYVVVDVETSGLHPDSGCIIEVAAIRCTRDGRVLDRFETLVNPFRPGVGRSDIHGITDRMIRKAPTFQEVASSLLNFMSDAVAVAHNAKFDERFLKAEFSRCGQRDLLIPAIDTLWLSRRVLTLDNHRLETIAKYYRIPNRQAHRAMVDVETLSAVLSRLLAEAPELGYALLPRSFPTQRGSFKPVVR